jgi:hypothetical protein
MFYGRRVKHLEFLEEINFEILQVENSTQNVLINRLREDVLIQNAKVSILEGKINALLNCLQLQYSGSTNEPVITQKENN